MLTVKTVRSLKVGRPGMRLQPTNSRRNCQNIVRAEPALRGGAGVGERATDKGPGRLAERLALLHGEGGSNEVRSANVQVFVALKVAADRRWCTAT